MGHLTAQRFCSKLSAALPINAAMLTLSAPCLTKFHTSMQRSASQSATGSTCVSVDDLPCGPLALPQIAHGPNCTAAHSHTYGNVLAKVPVFSDCETDFLNALTEKVNLRIYAPGDSVVRFGECGDEMFFLNRVRNIVGSRRYPSAWFMWKQSQCALSCCHGLLQCLAQGEVEVSLSDGRVVAVLGEGSIIGEVAFYGGGRRTATVTAKTW